MPQQRAINILLRAEDKASAVLRGASTNMRNTGRDAERMSASLKRTGDRITRDVMTPVERYQGELRELNTLLRHGAISQETYNRALSRSKAHYLTAARGAQGIRRDVTLAGGAVKGFTDTFGVGMLGTAAVVTGSVAKIRSSFRDLDKLSKTSSKIGVDPRDLELFRFAAEQTGVEVSTTDMALQRFTRRTAEAARGTGEAKDAIKELGLNARQLMRLPLRERMILVSDAFSRVEDDSDKLRLAFKLFDSEGAALVNTLSQGGDALDKLMRQRESLGGLFTQENLKPITDANDAWNETAKAWQAVWDEGAQKLAPALTEFAKGLTRLLKDTPDFGEQIGEAIGGAAKTPEQQMAVDTFLRVPGLSGPFGIALKQEKELRDTAADFHQQWKAAADQGERFSFILGKIQRTPGELFQRGKGLLGFQREGREGKPNDVLTPPPNAEPDRVMPQPATNITRRVGELAGLLGDASKRAGDVLIAGAKAAGEAGKALRELPTFKEETKRFKELVSFSEKVRAATRTPRELFEGQKRQLDTALRANLLDREAFNRGLMQANEELRRSLNIDVLPTERFEEQRRKLQETFRAGLIDPEQFKRGLHGIEQELKGQLGIEILPADRFQEQKRELEEALRAGFIDAGEFQRGLAKAREDAAGDKPDTKETPGLAAVESRFLTMGRGIDIQREMRGDIGQLVDIARRHLAVDEGRARETGPAASPAGRVLAAAAPSPVRLAAGGPVQRKDAESRTLLESLFGRVGSDTVPALLTPDEFVVPEGPARKYHDLLEAIRRDGAPHVQRFQAGGYVDPLTAGLEPTVRARIRRSFHAAAAPRPQPDPPPRGETIRAALNHQPATSFASAMGNTEGLFKRSEPPPSDFMRTLDQMAARTQAIQARVDASIADFDRSISARLAPLRGQVDAAEAVIGESFRQEKDRQVAQHGTFRFDDELAAKIALATDRVRATEIGPRRPEIPPLHAGMLEPPTLRPELRPPTADTTPPRTFDRDVVAKVMRAEGPKEPTRPSSIVAVERPRQELLRRGAAVGVVPRLSPAQIAQRSLLADAAGDPGRTTRIVQRQREVEGRERRAETRRAERNELLSFFGMPTKPVVPTPRPPLMATDRPTATTPAQIAQRSLLAAAAGDPGRTTRIMQRRIPPERMISRQEPPQQQNSEQQSGGQSRDLAEQNKLLTEQNKLLTEMVREFRASKIYVKPVGANG